MVSHRHDHLYAQRVEHILKMKPSLSPSLVPEPRTLELTGGMHAITPDKLIVIESAQPLASLFTAQEVQRALSRYAGTTWHIHASDAAPDDKIGLRIAIQNIETTNTDIDRQGYTLDITAQDIHIRALDPAGAFYGVMTLTQLLRQYGQRLPQLHIADHPDFARRGLLLDISRDKVPTMKTLFELVDLMAELKLNEFQLYIEHTFAFQRHPIVWQKASPMTGEEIMQLDAYCRARHIDLVPNQNCFGHMTPWLIHDEYRHLAECPDGCDTRWGRFDKPFTLCPGDPGSIRLVEEIFDEVLPHYTSRMFNVGCDETVDLGNGRSKTEVEARGVGPVYLDFVLKIYNLVKKHGRTMQFWGDIIMEHPELTPHLPKDAIAMEWGYEYDHPFAEHGAKFAASGIPFYVCAGTSSWNSFSGRTDNALGNLLNAAENGLKNGAIGFLNTDWGDNGHLQPLPVSFLPYAYGAAVSWCVEENRDTDIARSVSLHIFDDPSGATGKFVYDLGNVYRLIPERIHNGAAYAYAATLSQEALARYEALGIRARIDPGSLKRVQKAIARFEQQVGKLKIGRDDAELVKREFRYALALMRYGVERIQRLATGGDKAAEKKAHADLRKLKALHSKVWLARNRPGGMEDSQQNLRS
jgi:hypothetical protein